MIAATPLGERLRKLWNRLFEPVDPASLVFFRISFGALLMWEAYRYFHHGWIKPYYIDPSFHFTYYGFGWVRPWPGNGMYVHFVALGLLAFLIFIGLWYRAAAALFFLGFTYVFLLDQTRYLNHFYLISLVSFLLIFVPANGALSIDAWRNPRLRSQTAPRWSLWLLRAQFGFVYFFGGIAKLNSDWLQGEPLRRWLADSDHLALIGPFLGEEWVVMSFVYGGILFDLLAVPLLLWRKTRWLALAWAVAFHILNAKLFRIGVFPWFAMAGTLLFLPPSWPRFLSSTRSPLPAGETRQVTRSYTCSKPLAAVLIIFIVLQLLVPLRPFLYPGNVSWTEEGHRFSWHMKLRAKKGVATFVAHDRSTGQTREIDPFDYLTGDQVRLMSSRPDMLLQFAHFIAADLRGQGWKEVEVRTWSLASLNGRYPQHLVRPGVNLAAERRNLLPADWIVPLAEPLPRGEEEIANAVMDELEP